MSTVSEAIATQIIAQNGHYCDDPRVMQVITYDNAYGGKSWAILYERHVAQNSYAPSHYIRNPKIIWRAQ